MRNADVPGGLLSHLGDEHIHYIDIHAKDIASLADLGASPRGGRRRAHGLYPPARARENTHTHTHTRARAHTHTHAPAQAHMRTACTHPPLPAHAGGSPTLWRGVTKLYACACGLRTLDGIEALEHVRYLYLDGNALPEAQLLRLAGALGQGGCR